MLTHTGGNSSVVAQRHTARRREAEGQGLVEYAMILSLVAIVAFVALSLLGVRIGDMFTCLVSTMNSVGGGYPAVAGFELYDANADTSVLVIGCSDTIDLSDEGLAGVPLNIVAGTNAPSDGYVMFELDGPVSRTQKEEIPPFALFGDDMGGDFYGQLLPAGTYTLTATPHLVDDTAGPPMTVIFTIAD